MLHLHQIHSQASPYWDSLVSIYHTSFPLDEQRPIESIAHLIEHDARFAAYAIINGKEKENGDKNEDKNGDNHQLSSFISPLSSPTSPLSSPTSPIGLLTTWHFETFIYIEHFAIAPTQRSQGYGTEVLKALIHEQGKPIILEAEPPTDELSTRRIDFYRRCGLTLYDLPYMQPAYTPTSHPVELRLMGTLDTEAITLDHVSSILHREVYGV